MRHCFCKGNLKPVVFFSMHSQGLAISGMTKRVIPSWTARLARTSLSSTTYERRYDVPQLDRFIDTIQAGVNSIRISALLPSLPTQYVVYPCIASLIIPGSRQYTPSYGPQVVTGHTIHATGSTRDMSPGIHSGCIDPIALQPTDGAGHVLRTSSYRSVERAWPMSS